VADVVNSKVRKQYRVNRFLLGVANLLTLSRLLATPLLVYLLLRTAEEPHYNWIALLTIALLQASDVLDGMVARQARGKAPQGVNPAGEILDPIADKLYINSAVVTLAVIGRLDWRVAALIVARDVLILLGWSARYVFSGIRLLPNRLGKAADSLQAVLLVVVLLQPGGAIVAVFSWVAAALTVASGIWYARTALFEPRGVAS